MSSTDIIFQVYGLTDGFAFWTAHGTYAEYICVPDDVLAIIPPKLSFQEAASLPLVALTAYQVTLLVQSEQLSHLHSCQVSSVYLDCNIFERKGIKPIHSLSFFMQ